MRFSLPLILLAACTMTGCASSEKRLAQMQRKASEENSRRAEEMRMRTLATGEATSARGAEVIQYDPEKVFDPSRSGIGTARSYPSDRKAGTREFPSREARVGTFQTRGFYGSKTAAAAQKKHATGEADTRGKYEIPHAGREAATKTAATREAWDAQKKAASRESAVAQRPYLGPESRKLDATVDAKELANWRNNSEAVVYTDGVVQKVSTFKQLTIEDIRELLNKNR